MGKKNRKANKRLVAAAVARQQQQRSYGDYYDDDGGSNGLPEIFVEWRNRVGMYPNHDRDHRGFEPQEIPPDEVALRITNELRAAFESKLLDSSEDGGYVKLLRHAAIKPDVTDTSVYEPRHNVGGIFHRGEDEEDTMNMEFRKHKAWLRWQRLRRWASRAKANPDAIGFPSHLRAEDTVKAREPILCMENCCWYTHCLPSQLDGHEERMSGRIFPAGFFGHGDARAEYRFQREEGLNQQVGGPRCYMLLFQNLVMPIFQKLLADDPTLVDQETLEESGITSMTAVPMSQIPASMRQPGVENYVNFQLSCSNLTLINGMETAGDLLEKFEERALPPLYANPDLLGNNILAGSLEMAVRTFREGRLPGAILYAVVRLLTRAAEVDLRVASAFATCKPAQNAFCALIACAFARARAAAAPSGSSEAAADEAVLERRMAELSSSQRRGNDDGDKDWTAYKKWSAAEVAAAASGDTSFGEGAARTVAAGFMLVRTVSIGIETAHNEAHGQRGCSAERERQALLPGEFEGTAEGKGFGSLLALLLPTIDSCLQAVPGAEEGEVAFSRIASLLLRRGALTACTAFGNVVLPATYCKKTLLRSSRWAVLEALADRSAASFEPTVLVALVDLLGLLSHDGMCAKATPPAMRGALPPFIQVGGPINVKLLACGGLSLLIDIVKEGSAAGGSALIPEEAVVGALDCLAEMTRVRDCRELLLREYEAQVERDGTGEGFLAFSSLLHGGGCAVAISHAVMVIVHLMWDEAWHAPILRMGIVEALAVAMSVAAVDELTRVSKRRYKIGLKELATATRELFRKLRGIGGESDDDSEDDDDYKDFDDVDGQGTPIHLFNKGEWHYYFVEQHESRYMGGTVKMLMRSMVISAQLVKVANDLDEAAAGNVDATLGLDATLGRMTRSGLVSLATILHGIDVRTSSSGDHKIGEREGEVSHPDSYHSTLQVFDVSLGMLSQHPLTVSPLAPAALVDPAGFAKDLLCEVAALTGLFDEMDGLGGDRARTAEGLQELAKVGRIIARLREDAEWRELFDDGSERMAPWGPVALGTVTRFGFQTGSPSGLACDGEPDAPAAHKDLQVLRMCENPDCRRMERRKREFQLCSGCKAVVYCRRECQVAGWKGHKAECKKNRKKSKGKKKKTEG